MFKVWPPVFPEPPVVQNHLIPHLKALICSCLDPEVQGHFNTFIMCQALIKIVCFVWKIGFGRFVFFHHCNNDLFKPILFSNLLRWEDRITSYMQNVLLSSLGHMFRDQWIPMTNFKQPNRSDLECILRYFKFCVFYSCNLTPSGVRLVVNIHDINHTNTVIDKKSQ